MYQMLIDKEAEVESKIKQDGESKINQVQSESLKRLLRLSLRVPKRSPSSKGGWWEGSWQRDLELMMGCSIGWKLW